MKAIARRLWLIQTGPKCHHLNPCKREADRGLRHTEGERPHKDGDRGRCVATAEGHLGHAAGRDRRTVPQSLLRERGDRANLDLSPGILTEDMRYSD